MVTFQPNRDRVLKNIQRLRTNVLAYHKQIIPRQKISFKPGWFQENVNPLQPVIYNNPDLLSFLERELMLLQGYLQVLLERENILSTDQKRQLCREIGGAYFRLKRRLS